MTKADDPRCEHCGSRLRPVQGLPKGVTENVHTRGGPGWCHLLWPENGSVRTLGAPAPEDPS